MNPTFPNVPHGFPGGHGTNLLQANSFLVVPGHGTDGTKYTVKDQSGNPILWVFDLAHGQPQTSLVVKDAGQLDILRLSRAGTPGVNLQNPSGHPIGSVQIATKDVKEHKKEKYGKDKKRQIVLNDAMNHTLLTMSGKGGKKDGSLEMSIKSTGGSKLPGSTDLKHKDKDKKDKDKKDKDKKDKGKKKEVGEVTGSLATGLHVRLGHVNLAMPERVNVIGLLISYMELEKPGGMHGASAPMGVHGAMVYPTQPQHYPGHPVQPQHYPGQPAQQYPGQPGQQYPGQPVQQYPGQPVQQYPGQLGQHYPAQPAQHYPGQPHPGQQYPPLAHGGNQMGFLGQPQGQPPFPGQGQHHHQPNY